MMIFRRPIGAFALALILAGLAGSVEAQDTSPQQAAMQQAVQRAQSLTQEQIEQSHDVAALEQLQRIYKAIGDKDRYRWTLTQLTRLVPGSMQMKLELAASYAADDMKTPAYDLLLRMKGQGFGVDLSDAPEYEKIHGTQVWDYIVENLKANLDSFGEGKKAFDLPAVDLLFNALAWDPVHERFLAGSARDGGIYHVDRQGKLSGFIKADDNNKLWSIMDLAVDGKHKRLWVATTSTVFFKGYDTDNAGRAALLEFDLASGKLLHRYPLEGTGVFMSSLALAPDGTVYAADGVNKVVYSVEGGKLAQLVANPRLNDIRALAVDTEGRNLYLADTRLGVIGIDLKSKDAFNLGYNPEHLVLPGIVDMHAYKNTLVVIEPGMQPQRVMRLKLSDDGRSVTAAMPLDVANPLFTLLGNGTVVDDKLYYISNDQRGKYGRYGNLSDGAVLDPVHVFESDLQFAWDQSGISTGLSTIPVASPEQSRKLLRQSTGQHSLPGAQPTDNVLMQQPPVGSAPARQSDDD